MTMQPILLLQGLLHRLTAGALGVVVLAALAAGPAAAQSGEAGAAEALAIKADDPSLEWGPCPDFMPAGCAIALLQGNPGEPRADIFFRLDGGAEVVRHWHTSAERMVLVAGEMTVDYDGQDPVTLESGTYAYGPPELPHSAECVSSEACVLFIAFNEPIDAAPVAETN
ncbi:MAG: cupin domain-containing protein [Azospirillaceae bacterium]